MKNPSLESLYCTLNKRVLLVERFTEISNIGFIIKTCRLKPYSFFFEKRINKIILDKWWFDEYRNSFTIKKKKVEIIYGDLRLNRNDIACTDLYYGLDISKIAKISKSMYFTFDKDEDFFQDCVLISFLGIDNYLRTFLYYYGEWQRVSPLLIGIDGLGIIARNKDKNYHGRVRNSKKICMPCSPTQTWLTYLPISEDFLTTLELQCGIVASIFN